MATRLAHLGPRGTYTEVAALAYDPAADLAPCTTVAEAVERVERGEADAAVCAVENSLEGGVADTLDQLLRDGFSLQIRGEVVIPIRHALVAAAGIDPARATTVYSHPQALAQCRRRLGELAPDATPVASLSTAAAIEAAIAQPGAIAVGNTAAAAHYGATVYAEDIADEPANETRFIALARADAEPSGDDKTSIAFTTHHDRPGTLVAALLSFSERGISLTHVESRPTRRQLGTYVFLIDLLGHRTDAVVAAALTQVRRDALWLRVFGSYPRWSGAAAEAGASDA